MIKENNWDHMKEAIMVGVHNEKVTQNKMIGRKAVKPGKVAWML